MAPEISTIDYGDDEFIDRRPAARRPSSVLSDSLERLSISRRSENGESFEMSSQSPPKLIQASQLSLTRHTYKTRTANLSQVNGGQQKYLERRISECSDNIVSGRGLGHFRSRSNNIAALGNTTRRLTDPTLNTDLNSDFRSDDDFLNAVRMAIGCGRSSTSSRDLNRSSTHTAKNKTGLKIVKDSEGFYRPIRTRSPSQRPSNNTVDNSSTASAPSSCESIVTIRKKSRPRHRDRTANERVMPCLKPMFRYTRHSTENISSESNNANSTGGLGFGYKRSFSMPTWTGSRASMQTSRSSLCLAGETSSNSENWLPKGVGFKANKEVFIYDANYEMTGRLD